MTYGLSDTLVQQNMMNNLVSSLRAYSISAIGFVNEEKQYDQGVLVPLPLKLLNQWISIGFELGNHTYSHVDFNKVTFRSYIDEILRGERNSAIF